MFSLDLFKIVYYKKKEEEGKFIKLTPKYFIKIVIK